jgi:arsenite-transporting ATPase
LFTFPLICTLPEATPVHEAADLQEDLQRAGIYPFAWIINQSIAPLQTTDAVLSSRKNQERRYISEVCSEHTERPFLLPWLLDPVSDIVVNEVAEKRASDTG